MSEILIVLHDEVNCTFHNVPKEITDVLIDKFKRYVQNSQFSIRCTMGTWDGFINFYHKTGKTYVKLIDEIIPIILNHGEFEFNLVDNRKYQKKLSTNQIRNDYLADRIYKGTPWILRDYQVDIVNKLIEKQGGIAVAATGAGKSSICAALTKHYEEADNFKVLVIVPTVDLVIQTQATIRDFGLDAGRFDGKVKDLNTQHLVSTYQSLGLYPLLVQEFDVVIVDECHGAKAKTIKELLGDYGKHIRVRIGVTGTLPKDELDHMEIVVNLGNPVTTITAKELMDLGFLATLHITCYKHKVSMHKEYEEFKAINSSNIDYNNYVRAILPDFASEKKYLQSNTARLQWIAYYIEEVRSQGNVFVLVNGVAVGKQLSSMINDSVFISGGTTKSDMRERRYAQYDTEDGLVTVLTAHVASTGLDIPRIFEFIFVDMGKGFIRTIQGIGRGLRLSEDKNHVNVTDFACDFQYSSKHLSERCSFYREAKYPYSIIKNVQIVDN